jgi:hypothetical protein
MDTTNLLLHSELKPTYKERLAIHISRVEYRMSGFGRLLLYAVIGVMGPVWVNKQLFTMRDFKRNEYPRTAKTRHSGKHQPALSRLGWREYGQKSIS